VRALKKREPKFVEGVKKTMIIRGRHTSGVVTKLLGNLLLMKKPDAVSYGKKNPFFPFDDTTGLEFLSNKSDCSLFAFGSHSKKRPNTIIFGRLFDYNLLDMVEVGIENFQPLEQFKNTKWAFGTKPCIIFQGQEFAQNEDLKRLSNILLDFFRGAPSEEISLAGLDHVLVCTANQDKVYLRHYTIAMKKSGQKIPRVELTEVGPRFDMHVRRTKVASMDLEKEAYVKNRANEPKKIKNISHNSLQDKMGRVHISQDLGSIARKNPKALRANGRKPSKP